MVKFSIYLNRRVFVMKYAPHELLCWCFFKVYSYLEDILLQVFFWWFLRKSLTAQCGNQDEYGICVVSWGFADEAGDYKAGRILVLDIPKLMSFRHLLERRFFAWCFILNENFLFWLTISYQKPFVFPISMFCSQIFTLKLNLRLNVGLTYAISIVKWYFWIFV